MLEMLQRSEVSNPPAFGAKIASKIIGDETLRAQWFADMKTMSGRIREMRSDLYNRLVALGMYSVPHATSPKLITSQGHLDPGSI